MTVTAKGSEWALQHWGPGWPNCTANERVSVTIFGRSMAVVKGSQRAFRRIDRVFKKRCPAYYAGIKSTPDSGTYNCRPISGTSRPSFHSWPLSIDLRWLKNARDGDRESEMRERGMPAIRQLEEEEGFVWGGRWDSPDDMHIELCQTAAWYRKRYFWNGRRKPWRRK